jgi:DNA-directed RNA polymerase subunit beta'
MEKIKKKKMSFESIRIGIASPDQIKKWGERKLPNGKLIGEVKNSQTVNYKTLRPEKDGLFCEKIFGPITDFECICGKKQIFLNQEICPECDVEFTSAKIRRYRLGYINLLRPVTHVWFLRGRPNYFSILLNMPKKKLEAMAYCTDVLTNIFYDFKFSRTERKRRYTIVYSRKKKISFELSEAHSNNFFYQVWRKTSTWELSIYGEWEWFCFARFLSSLPLEINKNDIFLFRYKKKLFLQKTDRGDLGGDGIQKLLIELNLNFLEKELRNQLFCLHNDIKDLQKEFSLLLKRGYVLSAKEQKDLKKFFIRELRKLFKIRSKKIRRFKIIKQFRSTATRPEWLVLNILPVLPPDLRPIIQLSNDQVAVSDLNKFYQKILYRNKRFEWLSTKNIYEYLGLFQYEQRLFQEAVDGLIDNGKGGSEPITAQNERPLKSLSDILKGKKGRFRQNLLGKRVDYSGRSVIVVDPTLKLHQCGLPKEMAIELFQPFLIKTLMKKKKVRTIAGAKRILQKQNSFVLTILKEIMENHPVLLNRAPTLHRMGFQAFQPKLIEGRAILLHPLVCSAYNADFDGDQMGVHIPLSFEARAEAWTFLWSRNNLLSPATGQPSILPSQDIILGSFFLTTKNLKNKIKSSACFTSFDEAINFYLLENKSLHATLWIQWNSKIETLKEKEKIIELQIHSNGTFFSTFFEFENIFDKKSIQKQKKLRTTFGRIIFNQLINENLIEKTKEFYDQSFFKPSF